MAPSDIRQLALRVTKVAELHPQPFAVFGWLVTDAREVIRDLRTPDGVWHDDDGWVADRVVLAQAL